ncbi:MAG: DUF222 domain-containing protein [Nocardioides sp.]
MSISDLVPEAAPARVLAEALGVVRAAAETCWAARSDGELVEVVGLVQQLAAVLAVLEAGAVAEADARDLAKQELAYGSTGDWLTHTGGLRRGEGKQRVRRARALAGRLARVRQGLVDGRVSPGQADVIVAAVEQLPSGELVRARGEKLLVRQATVLDASELARAGRHLVHVVDPDADDRRLERALEREERAAHLARYLSVTDDGAGGVRVKGRGSAEDGALLKAALLPLTCPDPATNDPATGSGTGQPVRDPRDHGARLWDALVTTAQHALDTALPPHTHGTPARLLITLDHQTLKTGMQKTGMQKTGMQATGPNAPGVAATADGTTLPPGVLRRLACDAELIPAVLGSHGEVLDVGRRQRPVTPAIWTALVLRDRHCTFPACTRPPVMCHAHHLTHWTDGGTTTLDNLALLCAHHHRTIHHTPWEIRINTHDRKPEFLPPPKPGNQPEWTRYRKRYD